MLEEKELEVYRILKKQCNAICEENLVTERLRPSILAKCDIFSLTPQLTSLGLTPKDANKILNSLTEKGFVKVLDGRTNFPCFVPMGYWDTVTANVVSQSK
jgi:hypothetical protein